MMTEAQSLRMMSVEEFEAAPPEFRAAYWKREYMRAQLDRWSLASGLPDPDGATARLLEQCTQSLADAQRELDRQWDAYNESHDSPLRAVRQADHLSEQEEHPGWMPDL